MHLTFRSVRKAVSCLLILLLLIFAIFASSSAAASTSDTFVYDDNGNMINGSGILFVYNDANQLVRILNASDNRTVSEYFYDANGQRVKKNEGGVTTYYIGDLFETRVNGSTVENTSYYFANNERVARKDHDGAMYYYHGDHLGSTSVVTNESGVQTEKVNYYPYGSLKERMGEGSTYLFTDQEYDDESGLYYYDARYYNPGLTRFTQPDTITQNVYNPQNLNRYAYVLNNPIIFVDPTGHSPLTGWHEAAFNYLINKAASESIYQIVKATSSALKDKSSPTASSSSSKITPSDILNSELELGAMYQKTGTYYEHDPPPIGECAPELTRTVTYWPEMQEKDMLEFTEYGMIPKYYEGTIDPNREWWREYEPVYDEDKRFYVSTGVGIIVGGIVEVYSGGTAGLAAGTAAGKIVEGLYPPAYYEKRSVFAEPQHFELRFEAGPQGGGGINR